MGTVSEGAQWCCNTSCAITWHSYGQIRHCLPCALSRARALPTCDCHLSKQVSDFCKYLYLLSGFLSLHFPPPCSILLLTLTLKRKNPNKQQMPTWNTVPFVTIFSFSLSFTCIISLQETHFLSMKKLLGSFPLQSTSRQIPLSGRYAQCFCWLEDLKLANKNNFSHSALTLKRCIDRWHRNSFKPGDPAPLWTVSSFQILSPLRSYTGREESKPFAHLTCLSWAVSNQTVKKVSGWWTHAWKPPDHRYLSIHWCAPNNSDHYIICRKLRRSRR